MATETKLTPERGRKVSVRLEINGAAPDMGVWEILDRFKTITDRAKRTEIAEAMSSFMARPVNRQMVERWFRDEERLLPRTDYFLALVAVLTARFKVVETEDPDPFAPKRPRGRPRVHPVHDQSKRSTTRGRPRKRSDETADASV